MSLFSVFNKNEEAKNKSHIKNLLEVAISDGELDDRELELIISIAAKFDIPRKEVISIKEHHREIQFIPPSSYSAKVKLMEDLVSVLLADKKIEEEEINICKELAVRLKLNTAVVDDLINSVLNTMK
ncbi:MAG: hypothetical protein MI975_01700 [Cytophagales bacterium]|nr:hypothetical protein [Cytophagales bacterium]